MTTWRTAHRVIDRATLRCDNDTTYHVSLRGDVVGLGPGPAIHQGMTTTNNSSERIRIDYVMSILEIHADPRSYYARYSIADFAELVADSGWSGDEYEHEVAVAAYSLIMWPGSDCPWFNPGPSPLPADLKAWATDAGSVVSVAPSFEYPEAL